MQLPGSADGNVEGRICQYFQKFENQSHDPRNETVMCKNNDYCYGIWVQTSDGAFHPDKQGCWPSSNVLSCNSTCADNTSKSHSFYSCCCNTDMCNSHPPRVAPKVHQAPIHGFLAGILCLILILLISTFLGLFFMYAGVRKQLKGSFSSHSTAPLTEKGNLLTIELTEVIGHGRYGTVWKGLQAQREVAVKLFSVINHQHFANERSFHSLPLMEHENIVKFINAGERKSSNTVDYFLVTEYHAQGSLYSYLTKHSSNWRNTLKLAQTLTSGLSFLHTENWCRGFYKPVIVHRDLTSHNVLVKEGGSCVISDFGVAAAMNSHGAETCKTTRIYTVGTHRYMAPEILDGSINLRDCASTLKQADVYSLALILWEIFMKCTDLFSGGSVPDFQAAFEAETGKNPTFEQMVTIVSIMRQRPNFPANWNKCYMCILETIRDCWDHDSDARLTAQCVEQRMKNFVEHLQQELPNSNQSA
ncbi:bone morphogenetic protein receptor type-2-like isoform X1 [Scyliorhinus torazame]|uniref:bone morphogenetic protein receptor type-2-like isoform X1 n=2 Tax=Scyliorhinus torazame TaxID=75743 RepID=UPI003B5BF7BC